MQTPPAWKTALSLLLVLITWAAGILLAIGAGGKAPPIPWLMVASALIAVACTYAAVRLSGMQRLKESVAGFIVFTIFAIAVVPVVFSARKAATMTTCLSNSKQLALSLVMYANEFDDRFPNAANWNTITFPYRKQDFRCPESEAKATYALNGAVATQKQTTLQDPENTVLTFEHDSENLNQSGGENAVLFRHGTSASISCTDGHALRLNPYTNPKPTWNPR